MGKRKEDYNKIYSDQQEEYMILKQKLKLLEANISTTKQKMIETKTKSPILFTGFRMPKMEDLENVSISYLQHYEGGYWVDNDDPENTKKAYSMKPNGFINTTTSEKAFDFGVRPLGLFNPDDYDEIPTHFLTNIGSVKELSFTVIGDGIALCDEIVEVMPFNQAKDYIKNKFVKEYKIKLAIE